MLSRFTRFSCSSFNTVRKLSSDSIAVFNNLEVSSSDGVFTVGINRPEKRNCVNPETARELVTAFKQFEDDATADIAILYGKGENFCAGFDLSSLANPDERLQQHLEDMQWDGNSGIAPLGPSRMFIKKPVIAAVEGYCVAGGLELSLLCDYRVAGEGAVFGVFCRRFGVPLIDGGTVRLQKLIGLSRAMDMILTGRGVEAKEAHQFGLVNKLVDKGTALEEAMKLAQTIRKFPQKCLNADRQSVYYAAYKATSLEDALKYEYENGVKVLTEESVPGAKRFTEGTGRGGSFNLGKNSKPKL